VAVVLAVPNKRPAIPVGRKEPIYGFGAQLNTYVFTDVATGFKHEGTGRTQNLTREQRGFLKDAVCEAAPGHCRVFVRGLDPDSIQAPAFKAFVDTLEMAHAAGAKTVNLTWWSGPYADRKRLAALEWPSKNVLTGWPHPGLPKWPEELTKPDGPNGMPGPRNQMRRFARIIHEARKKFPCVTHATIQNEPNGSKTDIALKGVPNLSMRLYEHLYRAFADALAELDDPQGKFPNLRKAITIVAGDLLQAGKAKDGADSQDAWLRYLHDNMDKPRDGFPSVLDAYSIHVYWKPGPKARGGEFPDKPRNRLDNLEDLATKQLGLTKPIYVTEYGVRFPVKPESNRPGVLEGKPMERAPESVFEHAWFMARAPQKGCVGLVKWTMYRTDLRTGWGQWGLVDAPSTKCKRTPMFHMMRLFNRIIGQDWLANGLAEKEGILVSRFISPAGAEEAVVILNDHRDNRDVQLTNLLNGRSYERAAINSRAELARPPAVTADPPNGALRITIPGRGLVALSTRKIGLQAVP
jgi:hypothetical protein